jgi:hypothetical protein
MTGPNTNVWNKARCSNDVSGDFWQLSWETKYQMSQGNNNLPMLMLSVR